MPVQFIEEWIWESIPCSQIFEIKIDKDIYAIHYSLDTNQKHHKWNLFKNDILISSHNSVKEATHKANPHVKHSMNFFILSNQSDNPEYNWKWVIINQSIPANLFSNKFQVAKYKNRSENAGYELYAYGTYDKIEVHRNIPNHKSHIFYTDSVNEAYILSEQIGNLFLPIELHKFASYSRNFNRILNASKLSKIVNEIKMDYSCIQTYKLNIFGNTISGYITTSGYMEYQKELMPNVFEVHKNVSFDEMYEVFKNDSFNVKESNDYWK